MSRTRPVATDPRFWNQIGPFGGWLAASLLDAIAREANTPWPVLSVQVHFLAAVREGALDIRVMPVRRQRSLSLWRAQLWQDGEVAVEAEAVLAALRADPAESPAAVSAHPMPALPAPETLPRWHGVDELAAFVRAFDYRLASGAPFQGASRADTSGWLRLEAPTDFSGPARLLLLADAWFPALWSALTRPAPVTTVSLHVLFNPQNESPAATHDGHLAVHHRADAVAHGWGHERGCLWWPDGRLAAQAQQLTWIDLDKPHRRWPATAMRQATGPTVANTT
jgi:acyl-CoA thioesterase